MPAARLRNTLARGLWQAGCWLQLAARRLEVAGPATAPPEPAVEDAWDSPVDDGSEPAAAYAWDPAVEDAGEPGPPEWWERVLPDRPRPALAERRGPEPASQRRPEPASWRGPEPATGQDPELATGQDPGLPVPREPAWPGGPRAGDPPPHWHRLVAGKDRREWYGRRRSGTPIGVPPAPPHASEAAASHASGPAAPHASGPAAPSKGEAAAPHVSGPAARRGRARPDGQPVSEPPGGVPPQPHPTRATRAHAQEPATRPQLPAGPAGHPAIPHSPHECRPLQDPSPTTQIGAQRAASVEPAPVREPSAGLPNLAGRWPSLPDDTPLWTPEWSDPARDRVTRLDEEQRGTPWNG